MQTVYAVIAVLIVVMLSRIILDALQTMWKDRRRKRAHQEYKDMPRPQLTVVKGERPNTHA